MKKKVFLVLVLAALSALIFSACLLEGDIDQIRPRLKKEAEDPGYVLIPREYLEFSGGNITAYNGPGGKVIIPAKVDGIDVTHFGFSANLGGLGVFEQKGLTGVVIPNTLTGYIGASAFRYNHLTSVTIPDSVQSIFNYAFADNQLTSVTIPDSIPTIYDGVFSNNQLTSVTIPSSVTLIRVNAFTGNPITSITFNGSGGIQFMVGWIDNVGDLQNAYQTGGAGTYTRPDATSTVWTKQ